MWEPKTTGRVGLEVYYTGRQRLEVNPYRDESRRYVIVGLLAERRIGRVRLFINAENVTNVPADAMGSLLRPSRAPTAAGPSTPGRRSTGACSMVECGSISECHAIRVQSPICPM